MTRTGVKCSLLIPALPRRSAPSGGGMFRLVAGNEPLTTGASMHLYEPAVVFLVVVVICGCDRGSLPFQLLPTPHLSQPTLRTWS